MPKTLRRLHRLACAWALRNMAYLAPPSLKLSMVGELEGEGGGDVAGLLRLLDPGVWAGGEEVGEGNKSGEMARACVGLVRNLLGGGGADAIAILGHMGGIEGALGALEACIRQGGEAAREGLFCVCNITACGVEQMDAVLMHGGVMRLVVESCSSRKSCPAERMAALLTVVNLTGDGSGGGLSEGARGKVWREVGAAKALEGMQDRLGTIDPECRFRLEQALRNIGVVS